MATKIFSILFGWLSLAGLVLIIGIAYFAANGNEQLVSLLARTSGP